MPTTGRKNQDIPWPKKEIGVDPEKPTESLPIRQVWLAAMRSTTADVMLTRVEPAIMGANLKHLRSLGLTDDDIRDKIELFAKAMQSGKIKVGRTPAWFVFMKRWSSL